jgi:hypothetical protein
MILKSRNSSPHYKAQVLTAKAKDKWTIYLTKIWINIFMTQKDTNFRTYLKPNNINLGHKMNQEETPESPQMNQEVLETKN